MSDILLFGREATEIPDWFRRRLQDIDRALVVYWNPFHEQFTIDRCTRGRDCLSSNHLECSKTHVMFFPHVGEAALDKLKSMDTWTNGNDEAALLRFRRKHELQKEEWDANRKEEARESYKEAILDNRAQINKALHLIQQHDIGRVH